MNWLRHLLPSQRPAPSPTVFQALHLIKARYDAAATTEENRRHWQHADDLSANAAHSPEVRRLLRIRCRYEIANNSYAKGLVLTLAHDTVGTGPRLQLLSNHAVANHHVEIEFGRWAKEIRLAERLRTLRMARAADGETFALLTHNPALPTPVQLDLRLVEADQVTTPDLSLDALTAVDGIVFDVDGNPVEYHVLRQHPGDLYGGLNGRYDRVPAAAVIHYFRGDRPGQARGIPDITPALPLFAHLRRYTLAVITAAEIAALPGGVLYTDAPANGEAESVEPMDLIELERGMLMTMPGGWKMSQLQAQFPTTTYAEFKREILGEIGRCLLVPVNVLTGDSSRHNYASGRLDHQTYFKSIRVEQAHLEVVVMDRILQAWFDEARRIPGYLPEPVRRNTLARAGGWGIPWWPHAWMWDGMAHVDPLKEANAQAVRLTSFTTTLADEYARMGLDWETQLRQRAKELELMLALGLAQSGDRSPESGVEDEDIDTEEEETVPNAA
ncbi:MAG: phage portal protein [Planctomycetaceae bacterium]|nr:phage portal protein [Planctomycetaceae bacterium]